MTGGEGRVITRRMVRGEPAMTLSGRTKIIPVQTESSLKALRETSSRRQNLEYLKHSDTLRDVCN